MAVQESKGATLSTFSATFIDRAIDFFMGACSEALTAPTLDSKGGPEAMVGPMSLAIASPTVCLASWTVEREMVGGLTAETELSILVLLCSFGSLGSLTGGESCCPLLSASYLGGRPGLLGFLRREGSLGGAAGATLW